MVTQLQNWLVARGKAPIGVWILALGACMTLGFAPFGLWPVAVLSLAGLWWLVRHAVSGRQAFGASIVWGMGHGLTALYWMPWAFYKDSGGDWLAALGGGGAAVVGIAFYGALGMALAGLLAWKTGQRAGWNVAAVVWVAAWVGIEFAKGLHPMGFPWLPVGAVFANSLYLLQGAALGGVWLLSAIALGMAAIVGNCGQRGLIYSLILVVVMGGAGAVRVHGVQGPGEVEMVRVVQPNIQSAHKWDAQKRWAFLQETLAVALSGDPSTTLPRTVIMPETAVAFYLDEEDDVRNAVAGRIAARLPTDGALVTGTVRREVVSDDVTHYYNSLAVMDVKGILRDVYDKRLLVPFGEYIPGREWLEKLPLPMTLRTISQSRIDFTHGKRDPLLGTPAGEAVGLICYEGIFPLQVAKAAVHARYLINITNDSWWTGTIALYQHAAHARLRAVETGLPMVRVANTGITVVYDGLGREVARLPIDTPAKLDVALPPALPATPFVKMVAFLSGL